MLLILCVPSLFSNHWLRCGTDVGFAAHNGLHFHGASRRQDRLDRYSDVNGDLRTYFLHLSGVRSCFQRSIMPCPPLVLIFFLMRKWPRLVCDELKAADFRVREESRPTISRRHLGQPSCILFIPIGAHRMRPRTSLLQKLRSVAAAAAATRAPRTR